MTLAMTRSEAWLVTCLISRFKARIASPRWWWNCDSMPELESVLTLSGSRSTRWCRASVTSAWWIDEGREA
jgi:hypothetical protein